MKDLFKLAEELGFTNNDIILVDNDKRLSVTGFQSYMEFTENTPEARETLEQMSRDRVAVINKLKKALDLASCLSLEAMYDFAEFLNLEGV